MTFIIVISTQVVDMGHISVQGEDWVLWGGGQLKGAIRHQKVLD